MEEVIILVKMIIKKVSFFSKKHLYNIYIQIFCTFFLNTEHTEITEQKINYKKQQVFFIKRKTQKLTF